MTTLLDDPKKVYTVPETRDPTAQDDKTAFIAVGCRWVNTSTGAVFVCQDNHPGAAVWVAQEGLSGGLVALANIPVLPGSKLQVGAVGTAALADLGVTAGKLANGAGVAALLAAGLGSSAAYTKATAGAQTLLALHASKDRACLIMVVVTETFADGDGTQPTFTIGETSTATKFAGTAAFAGKVAGTVLFFAGTNLATKNVLVTGVAGTGTTETGAISVTVLAIPTT